MALRSMTGHGRGEAVAGGIKVTAELASVNRKQSDVRIAMPRSLAALESRVTDAVHKAVARGAVTGTLDFSLTGRALQRAVSVDTERVEAYVRAIRKTAKALGLVDDLKARVILNLPDVLKDEGLPEDPEAVWPVIRKALQGALAGLIRMRSREGKALARDLAGRFKALEADVRQIKTLAPDVVARYRALLAERIRNAGVAVPVDDQALAKEVALFADRSDISEEIVRLESHFAQAYRLMSAEEPAGRSLDFLCQEMFREINTIGSKANSAELSARVIHFKAGLEAVREQVQNVE